MYIREHAIFALKSSYTIRQTKFRSHIITFINGCICRIGIIHKLLKEL